MTIQIQRVNHSHDKIICDQSIAYDIRDHFSFQMPNAKFHPLAKYGWDGIIKLFDMKKRLLPAGLRNDLFEFLTEMEYEYEYDEIPTQNISLDYLFEWAKTLDLPDWINLNDYQLRSIQEAVKNNNRCLFLSATNSGKTLISYFLHRWYQPKRMLVIVPRVPLVKQFKSDFKSYNYEFDFPEIDKTNFEYPEGSIIVANWQAIHSFKEEWFHQFDMIIGDEAHNMQAKSLSNIMNNSINANIRFGLTGSLSGAKIHEMVITGHFGKKVTLSTNKELIDRGINAKIKINIIVLKYPDEDRKLLAKKDNKDYQTEVEFLENNTRRNKFLANMVMSQKQNSFLLFKHIEHGELLHSMLEDKCNKKLFYVAGSGELKTSADEAEEIRLAIDRETESITLASLTFFSEGINIKKLNDVIFGAPSKSRIKVMQAIGRGFRISENKDSFVLWDIADNLCWKNRKNHTMKHLFERIKYYNEEQLEYKIYEIDL